MACKGSKRPFRTRSGCWQGRHRTAHANEGLLQPSWHRSPSAIASGSPTHRDRTVEQAATQLLRKAPPPLSKRSTSSPGVSSRRLRQEVPDLARHYWRARRLWSGSYVAGSVAGARLNVLRVYLEQQRRPHDAMHLRPQGRSPLAKA